MTGCVAKGFGKLELNYGAHEITNHVVIVCDMVQSCRIQDIVRAINRWDNTNHSSSYVIANDLIKSKLIISNHLITFLSRTRRSIVWHLEFVQQRASTATYP